MTDLTQLEAISKRTLESWTPDSPTYQAAAAVLEVIVEVRALRGERERLDFICRTFATWYPNRTRDGCGELYYDDGKDRAFAAGGTMREAIDAARSKEKA